MLYFTSTYLNLNRPNSRRTTMTLFKSVIKFKVALLLASTILVGTNAFAEDPSCELEKSRSEWTAISNNDLLTDEFLLHTLQCLGRRVEEHQNGTVTVGMAADLIQKLFEIEKSKSGAKAKALEIYNSCKELKKKLADVTDVKFGRQELDAVMDKIKKKYTDQSIVYRIFNGYKNSEVICLPLHKVAFEGGVIISPFVASKTQTCLTPFGFPYKHQFVGVGARWALGNLGVFHTIDRQKEPFIRKDKSLLRLRASMDNNTDYGSGGGLAVGNLVAHDNNTRYQIKNGLGAYLLTSGATEIGIATKLRKYFYNKSISTYWDALSKYSSGSLKAYPPYNRPN